MSDPNSLLDAYLDHLRIERRLSPRTVDSYRADLLQHLGFVGRRTPAGLGDVDAETLREDLARLHRLGRARRSLQRYRSSLRGFYRFLRDQGWIDADPSTELEGPAVRRPLPRSLAVEDV
ncbi:MAG: site-specific integrase, partial [Candidatus Eisenbacteria bacterium]|nr:site-specific integrase [Candidatus Eisenbacteria bacterium]